MRRLGDGSVGSMTKSLRGEGEGECKGREVAVEEQ